MPRAEGLEQLRRYTEERQPLFGKDVVLAHEEPGLGAVLIFVAGRGRQLPEIAFAQRGHFVRVVENDLAIARDAEILEQQIPRENVDAGELTQRIAVVEQRTFRGGGICLANKKIERAESPLDVTVADDEVITVEPA